MNRTPGGASRRFRPAGLPVPDPAAAAHGRRAAELLRRRIESEGPLPFAEYMDFCLHDPRYGYYPAGGRNFGAEGDFVTAPELSPLFGRCVARQFEEVLARLGGGEILEIGGGTGAFAESCLGELARGGRTPPRYRILETSADLRARQQERLAPLGVEWPDRLPEEPFEGVVFANEVADALPVERFRVTPRGVESLHVDFEAGGFRWTARPAGTALLGHVAAVERRLGRRLGAPGHESEWCPSGPAWIEALAAPLRRGLLLVIDYGYGEAEYYHPDRATGTLGCHYRHRWHDDPLILPTLQDITASVDFSALARAGDAAGLERFGFTTQAWFLFGCGLASLFAAPEPRPDPAAPEPGRGPAHPSDTSPAEVAAAARARAVRQLTMPGEMGERLRVLALGRGLGGAAEGDALRGFGGRRLDGRL